MKTKKLMIAPKLLKIFNSKWDNKELIDYIKRLLDCNVLTNDESELLKIITEQIELTGSYNVIDILQKKMNFCWRDSEQYADDEIQFIANEYIEDRIARKLDEQKKLVYEDVGNKFFDRTDVAWVLNRYAGTIKVKKRRSPQDILDSLKNVNQDIDTFSTANSFIDTRLLSGIKSGQITTIMGNDSYAKSMWALNIAYHALKNKKNVLYFTIGLDEDGLNERFMLLHSYSNLDFKDELIKDGNNEDGTLDNVLNDFYSKFSNNLIVYDETYFEISSANRMQMLLVSAETEFIKLTGTGIDLIIVDDLTQMKLNDGFKSITNKKKIQDEYFSFFRNQSRNLLGKQRMVSIVVTYMVDGMYYKYFDENVTFTTNMIPDAIQCFSDNLLSIKFDSVNASKANLFLIKSFNGKKMDNYEEFSVCSNNFYMPYTEEDEVFLHRCSDATTNDNSNEDNDYVTNKYRVPNSNKDKVAKETVTDGRGKVLQVNEVPFESFNTKSDAVAETSKNKKDNAITDIEKLREFMIRKD